ncbi:hypothetical protein GCM10010387_33120 [Streptomyces inusitatus]|uniref:Uncharacterized protein n=1 Tax=Streptomyces inusitatus TaxID=68221 RepID=A0A918Q8K8_9ACTN|nr:hypothetical protein [Streptomyces inusitatus]GGZ36437.1 hypothetical protein GCM10010387_33120 [Streptomyces inusitatus]
MATDETAVHAQDENPEWDGGYVASAQERELAEQAQKELAALGAAVEVKTKWWGFEIHLNAEASATVVTVIEQIGNTADAALGGKIGGLVKVACLIRAALIAVIGRNHGCKLVSPWIMPSMLIPLSLAPKDDASLYWTVGEPGAGLGWSEDTKFAAHGSAAHPALAVPGQAVLRPSRTGRQR